MLAEAYELELIKTNPSNVRVVVPGERSIKKPKTMTSEQVATVLQNLPQRDRVLFAFLSFRTVRHRVHDVRADAVRRLDVDRALLIDGRLPPAVVRVTPWWEDRGLRRRAAR